MTDSSKKTLGFSAIFLGILSVAWLSSQLYFTFLKPIHPMVLSPVFLSFALAIVFVSKPFPGSKRFPWLRALDFGMVATLAYIVYFYSTEAPRIINRIPHIDDVLTSDKAVLVVLAAFLLEAVRRVLGWNLVVFVSLFIIYAFAGPWSPGFTKFAGFSLEQFTEIMTLTTEGIYGTPLSATASFIFYFILFGSFFSACGGGQVLIDIGLKVSSGGTGGPAKAAVVSSALMGMISGSAVANVATTGVLTIPMMKKVGYTPEQAGAIEAVASTGGQIMPPIMGVGAFIMAELLGVNYKTIAISAAIPAAAYFLSVLLLVGFIAKKRVANRRITHGDEEAVVFEVAPIAPRLYLLLPAVLLVYMVLTGDSLRSSAIYSTSLILILNLLPFNRTGIRELYASFIDGISQAAAIALPTAACGIIIGTVVQSGLANKFSAVVSVVGGSSILAALLITTLGCMLLGMALPTVAAYLIAVVLFVPVMLKLGLPILVAHMFCFYYGVIAQITPPVCLASFTAAGIAGGDSWRTGWTGFAYASVAFLIPFVFVYQPAILLIGSPFEIVVATIFLCLGVYALAAAIGNYLYAPIGKVERTILLLIAILLIVPELITSVVGAAALAILVVRSLKKRNAVALPAVAAE